MASPSPRGPVRPGVYRYGSAGTTTVGLASTPFPAVTTLTVDPPAGSRQRSVRDLRDGSGNGSLTESVFEYRTDGIFLVDLRLVTTLAGLSDIRRLQPAAPVLFLPTGAGPGTVMRFDVPVTAAGGTPAGVATVTVEAGGTEKIAVGLGGEVDSLVVRVGVRLPPGDVTGSQDLTVWLDAASGLYIKERSVTNAAAAGGLLAVRTDYTATLEKLP